METIPTDITRSNKSNLSNMWSSDRSRAPATPAIVENDGIETEVPRFPTSDFESFYLDQYPKMVRLAYALVDTPTQAEEVTQDAFAAVLQRWNQITNRPAYLRVTVINRCRRIQRRRMLMRARPAERSDNATQAYNHVADATRRLPHRQQAMIALRYDLQLTDTEIAETLGIPVGTVKSTLHRALATLRQEIQND